MAVVPWTCKKKTTLPCPCSISKLFFFERKKWYLAVKTIFLYGSFNIFFLYVLIFLLFWVSDFIRHNKIDLGSQPQYSPKWREKREMCIIFKNIYFLCVYYMKTWITVNVFLNSFQYTGWKKGKMNKGKTKCNGMQSQIFACVFTLTQRLNFRFVNPFYLQIFEYKSKLMLAHEFLQILSYLEAFDKQKKMVNRWRKKR